MQRLEVDDLENYIETHSLIRWLVVLFALCCTLSLCVVVLATAAVFLASVLVGHAVDTWLLPSTRVGGSAIGPSGIVRAVVGVLGLAITAVGAVGARMGFARRRALLARLRHYMSS
jgi:hypothetical protein